MLIGKTDPYIAVFTKAEKSAAWSLVGCTGAASAPSARAREPAALAAPAAGRRVPTILGRAQPWRAHRVPSVLVRPPRLTHGRRADVVAKSSTPEFKKPVLVDFFFEEVQLLRFQVSAAARRSCATRLTDPIR